MENNEKNVLIKKLIDTEEDMKDFWNELPAHLKDSVKQAKEELQLVQGIPHDKEMTEIKNKFLKNRCLIKLFGHLKPIRHTC